MKIEGIQGMSADEIRFEVQRGGKFVFYHYCISAVLITFRRPTAVYFIRSGQSAVGKGLSWSLLTVVLGWWGIPWGPIYSIQSLIVNFRGGKDVTAEIAGRLQSGAAVSSVPVKA
jgi:hypothetical protein